MAKIGHASLEDGTDLFKFFFYRYIAEDQKMRKGGKIMEESGAGAQTAGYLWKAVQRHLGSLPFSMDQFSRCPYAHNYEFLFQPFQKESCGNSYAARVWRQEVPESVLKQSMFHMAQYLEAESVTDIRPWTEAAVCSFWAALSMGAGDIVNGQLNDDIASLLIKKYSKKMEEKYFNHSEKTNLSNEKNRKLSEKLSDMQILVEKFKQKQKEQREKTEEETRQIRQSFDSTLDEIQEGIEADKRMAEEEEQGQTMDLTEEEQALLAGRRVVVLGGLPKWQTRLRQQYPNVTCIPPENLHFDNAMIRDADTVVVAIKYIGHSMGERAMIRYLAQYGVKTVYFYGSNEERLLRRIYETLSV